jgi:thiol-disulfide isomerase/thioredoxin
MVRLILLLTILLSSSLVMASSFPLTDLQGNSLDESTLKKRVILYFWATWCVECKAKMKSNFDQKIKQSGVSLLWVNLDKNIRRTKHYMKKNNFDYLIYRDVSKHFINKFSIAAAPFWLVYQRDGQSWTLLQKGLGEFSYSY